MNRNTNFSDLLLLNVLVKNINKINKNNSSIVLINWNTILKESIYFSKKSFTSIKRIINLKTFLQTIIFLNKSNSDKIVINTSNSLFVSTFTLLVLRGVKARIKNSKLQGEFYKKAIYLNEKLNKVHDLKIKLSTKPFEYINKTELNHTTNYINWTLNSSGFKNLNQIRFIYILLKTKNLEVHRKEMEILSNLVKEKNNFKIIFTFLENSIEEINNFIESLNDEIKRRIIGKEFFNYDKNFVINLISKSRFILTDYNIYYYFANSNDLETVMIQKKEDQNKILSMDKELSHFKNKVMYSIKNS